MKTVITILAVSLYAFAAQAQDQSKKDPKAEQAVSQEEAKKAKARNEAEDKKAELDPNTRAHLDRVRHQLYSFGRKPGC